MTMFSIFKVSGSALQAQSIRMNVAASNLANANSVAGPDGEPYRAKQVVFRALGEHGMAGVGVSQVVEDQAPFKQVYRPSDPRADGNGYVRMPNIKPIHEMVNMIEASRSYQANVNVLDTSKKLLYKTLRLGEM